jgi:hypothetical protein
MIRRCAHPSYRYLVRGGDRCPLHRPKETDRMTEPDDPHTCTCPSLRELALNYYGQRPPACPIHRPEARPRVPVVGLNSDRLLSGLRAHFGADEHLRNDPPPAA